MIFKEVKHDLFTVFVIVTFIHTVLDQSVTTMFSFFASLVAFTWSVWFDSKQVTSSPSKIKELEEKISTLTVMSGFKR